MAFGNTASHASTPNFSRLKYGLFEVVSLPSPALTQINPGDFILLNAGVAALMSALAWDTDLPTSQLDAAALFLGICLDQKNAADPTTRNITVVTRGFATYPCTALGGAQHIGANVAPAGDGVHNLYDQQVAIAGALAGAIGKLSAEAAVGAISLTFFFESTLLYGAVAAA